MSNPCQDYTKFPDFKNFDAAALQQKIQSHLQKYQQVIDEVCQLEQPDWNSLVIPLERMEFELAQYWSPIRHLNAVQNNESLREIYNQLKNLLSEFYTHLGQNEKLYQAYQKLSQQKGLDSTQQKIVNDNLLAFRLSGVSLDKGKKQQYQQIQKILTKLSTQFSENVLDCTQQWEKLIGNKAELKGIPDHILQLCAQKAEQKKLKGWLLTLDFPVYYAVISYAENADLRKAMYFAYTTRASTAGEHDARFDNSLIIDQILDLKKEKADLLGFKNYAELSIADKMAESPQQVKDFLLDLSQRSRSHAEQDLQELKAFVGQEKLEPWDISYYSEKLKHQRFQISDEMLQPYFPEHRVLEGLFRIVNMLYGVQIEQIETDNVWHEDVRLYKISDQQQTCGYFYLDLYARENKRGGAWMDECANRINIDGKQHYPIAYLTCNLTPPVADKPALFTHDEVVTLFHEFGHGLHHMMTRVDYPEAAGINGVEWDAVELPSQFMENWCWDKNMLKQISGHYQSGEALPEDLQKALIDAKNFQAAMQMLRQIEFALFDMEIHSNYQRDKKDFVQKTLDKVRKEHSVIIPPSFNRFQNSFSHIFAGGYAAGYYSYKWAEVLSADVYAAFEEVGTDQVEKIRQVGLRFLQEILQKGGSEPALDLFVHFRGRKPKNDALLKHCGIN